MAGDCDEVGEGAVGDGRAVDEEAIHADSVRGGLLRIVAIRAHGEAAGGYPLFRLPLASRDRPRFG